MSNMFLEIYFITHQYNKVLMFPNKLTMDKAILDFFELKTELESLTKSDDEENVIKTARLINKEKRDLKPEMSCPPQEDPLRPERTNDYIPHLLNVFFMVLISGKSIDSVISKKKEQ